MFDEVRTALEQGDDVVALEKSLAYWRETRNPAVGSFVVRLTSGLTTEPLKGHTKVLFHQAWMERVTQASVLDVGMLAQSLFQKLPVEKARRRYQYDLNAQYAPLFARLDALRKLGPDPRIGWAMVEHLRKGAIRVGWDGDASTVYGPLVLALEESVDGRMAEAIREISRNPTASTQGLRNWQRASLKVQSVAATEDGKPWDGLYPEDAGPVAAAGEFLEAIRSQPDERGLREVYADILQQASDPHGRFISLQLEGTEAARKQAGKLLRKHQKDWLGPDLSRALVRTEFEDGFLTRAEVGQNARCDREGWMRAFVDPRLATLRRLRKGRGNTNNYLSFLRLGGAPHLNDVEAPNLATLTQICKIGLPIEYLDIKARMPKGNRLAPLAQLSDTLREVTVTWGRDSEAAPLFRRWRKDLDTYGSPGLKQVFIRLNHDSLCPMDVMVAGLRHGFDAVGIGYPWQDRLRRVRRTDDGLVVELGSRESLVDIDGMFGDLERVVKVRVLAPSPGMTRSVDVAMIERAFPGVPVEFA